jgi:hypothetical protein
MIQLFAAIGKFVLARSLALHRVKALVVDGKHA